jgi:tetratricopeptide (TPR) repeat protein
MSTNRPDVRKAAYELRQSFQFDAARALLEEALRADLPPAGRWALHYDLGKVHQDQFEMEEALHHYHEAINGLQASEEGPSVFLARLYGACGLIHQDEGREEDALRCHHRAADLLQQLPESEAALFLASNLKYLGELYQEQGQLPKSREHYRSALPLLQQRLGEGEGFLYLETATVALQLAAVELELYLLGNGRTTPAAIRQLLTGAQSWLEQLDAEDSIVEQRTADLQRLSFMVDKVDGA